MNHIDDLKKIVAELDFLYFTKNADEEIYFNRKLEKEDKILQLEMLRDEVIKNLE
jgi:hypothetical protein